jgi:hypothetical protein
VRRYTFSEPLWEYTGDAPWCLVTLPTEVADEIDHITSESRRGFGSVRVEVTVGSTTWNTSIFPDRASQSFVLPVKKAVRLAEQLQPGSPVVASLVLVDF